MYSTYKITKRRGIDDLQSIYAFYGNSQGDHTQTNEISDYIASKGWLSYGFKDIDITDQEAIYKESVRRVKENEACIAKLKEEGRYGEEYSISIEFMYNASLDEPNLLLNKTSSCEFKIFDINDNEHNK